MEASLGKMPTTLDRRLISPLTRSKVSDARHAQLAKS